MKNIAARVWSSSACTRRNSRLKRTGATAPASDAARSPETYLGYARQQNLVSPEAIKKDTPARYSTPRTLEPDQWALSGKWVVSGESSVLQESGGAIAYRFYGRDLHLVLGSRSGDPVRSEEHTSELQSLAYLVCRL